MPEATQPVKHIDYSSAARENGTFSHLYCEGEPSTLMLEVGAVFQYMYGYFTLTYFHRHGWLALDSNKIEIEVKEVLGEIVFMLFFCRQDFSKSYITITENDAHAIILTFNCDIKDDLNVLGYIKKEVIATGSDQEPVAGTNNANIRG